MIIHFGYSDGSGDYYLTVDTDKCNGCSLCVQKCPQQALQIETMQIDLEDKPVAILKEENRKKIKYTCAACKPRTGSTPCSSACKTKAIKCLSKPS
jgi:Fe-S-cluster-containing hydrogenase component 2